MNSKIAERNTLFSGADLKKLIRPLIVEQFLAVSVGMIDTVMLSSCGNDAVSGVSVVDMINVLLINIFAALATGGAIICANEVGLAKAKSRLPDYSKARNAAKHLLVILFVFSTVIAVAAYILRGQILAFGFGKLSVETMEYAKLYFAISALSYPFIALYNGFAAIFRTMGKSRVTMITSALVNVLNIIGNGLLIFVFDLDVLGAAIATAFSRMAGMLVLMVNIMNKNHDIYISFHEKFKLRADTIKQILEIGIPSGFENGIFRFGRILVISMISIYGETQVAANSVASNLDSLGCIPGQAIGLAMVTVVGQCIGAGEIEAANCYRKLLMKKSFIYMAAINAVIILTLPISLSLYQLSDDAIRIATVLILIHTSFAGAGLWSLAFVAPSVLRAAHDVRFTMVVSVSSMIGFRVILSYVIGVLLGVGILGVWIATIGDWIFRTVMFTWRIRSGKWLSHVPGKA